MHNAWNQPPAELVGCIELFEAAMAIDGHRRVIEAYARQLRTREWQAQHRQATRCVRRHVDEGKRLGLGGADITTLRAVLEDYAELLGTRAGAKEPSDA